MNGIWTSDCSLKILRGTFLNKFCPFRLLTSKRFIYAGPHLEIRFFSFGNEIAHKKYWVPHKNHCLFNYGSLRQGFFSKRFSWWLRWGLSPHLREHRICDEISLPLTFNKLELLLLPPPSPMMGTRDTCVARVATRTKLVQTPGKSPSLWACEHRQGGDMGDGGESWERRCQFPFSGIPWGCLTKMSWITETWIYEHSIEKVTSNWTNVTSISVQMFQQLSSDESLCYLLLIADYTVYPVI